MAQRVYLVPKIGAGTFGDAYRPKYVSDPAQVASKRWQAMDYGLEPVFLAVAEVTPAEHTAIAANADVTACPADLDQTIGGALATVQSKLEAWNLPAEWITSGMTYRTVLRQLTKLFAFMQRYHGQVGRLFGAGFTLDDTFGSLPLLVRQRLAAVAATFPNVDTSGITGPTTLRASLAQIIVQIPAGKLGGVL